MPPENEMNPQDDIQQALSQAQSLSSEAPGDSHNPGVAPLASDTLVHAKGCPILGLRYGVSKCGMMAQKYPWQTTAALLVSIGCGWLCSYFGWSMLAGLVLYAIYGED